MQMINKSISTDYNYLVMHYSQKIEICHQLGRNGEMKHAFKPL